MCCLLLASFAPAAAQPSGVLERAFFYNDIYHFVGKPYESPPLGEVQTVAQPFVSKCSNLNRIILPFYVKEQPGEGELIFNLYQTDEKKKLVFSTPIDVGEFPSPAKIGTHRLQGVLKHIWIPPQTGSEDQAYLWEVLNNRQNGQPGMGLYLTQRPNPQLQPVLIDNIVQEKTYAAFYSYCIYRFEWDKIFSTIGCHLAREKYFLGVYLVLLGVLGICLRKAGTG